MMSGTADDLGNIDLEDSQKGLPDRAYLPSSPDGSFRSSLEDSSSARQYDYQPMRTGRKKSPSKKKKAAGATAGKVNYASPTASEMADSHTQLRDGSG